MKKGDKRLDEIFVYIKNFINDKGYAPSVREIGDHFAIKSPSTVHYYLQKLRSKGMITPHENKSRALSITQTRAQANYVPLVGDVSAGKGILAVENIEGEFPIPQDLFLGNDLFMLRIQGDSMINAGIFDGDYVIVQKQASADIGDIVIALWEEKATVKRLAATTPNLVLHPENDTMTDIIITPQDDPIILGKVIGSIKKF
ncbi:MAG: transcriptional repressor LexA [Clostridia bacterium]|nr:transcriptional repressor LexA [Clostridia bacterium]